MQKKIVKLCPSRKSMWTASRRRSIFVAFFALGFSFMLAALSEGFLPGSQVLLFLMAGAAFSALYGGLLIGVFSAVASALGHIFFFQDPARSFGMPTATEFSEVGIFLVVSIFIAWLGQQLRSSCAEAISARKEADDASEAREYLLAVVSHDLKNPLTAIQLQAELLTRSSQENSNSHVLRAGRQIYRASDRAIRLIKDLLDFEKIRVGNLTVEKDVVSAALILEEAAELMIPIIESRMQVLKVLRPEPGFLLSCDRTRVMQALSNLLGNAAKFSDEGSAITLGCTPAEAGLRFYVRDNGPGIPKEQLPRVFDRYWQESKTARYGTGLGLSIVKGIMEAHGGRVDVESVPGAGACFSIWFPGASTQRRQELESERQAGPQIQSTL